MNFYLISPISFFFTQCTTNASITIDIATKKIVRKIPMIIYPTATAKNSTFASVNIIIFIIKLGRFNYVYKAE